MTESLTRVYRARIESGELTPDPDQARAVERLDSLRRALARYRPPAIGGWKSWLGLARRNDDPPSGVYLFGAWKTRSRTTRRTIRGASRHSCAAR